MDFLSQAVMQVNDLFRSLTPPARIAAGLLLAVVVMGLVFLFRLPSSSPHDYLLGAHVFSPNDLMAAQGALGKAGLHCEIEGSRISVPSGQQATYVAALVDAGALPRHIGSWWREYDEKSSLFESQKQSDIRFKLTRQQELTEVLRRMEGVAHASVHIDEAQKGSFPRKTECTASVAIELLGGAELDPGRVKSIRQFVAGAVAGLEPGNVIVMNLTADHLYPEDADGNLPVAENDQYAAYVRGWEQHWTQKVKGILGDIQGVKVAISVLPAIDMRSGRSSFQFEPRGTVEGLSAGAAASQLDASRTAANQQATIVMRPGPPWNKQGAYQLPEKLVRHQRDFAETAPAAHQRVTVSVAVPRSHYRRVWESRNRGKDGHRAGIDQELRHIEDVTRQTIQERIVNLLPPSSPADGNYTLVNVTTFEDVVIPPLPQPSFAQKAGTWLAGNWSTLGVIGVGLAGLLVLRGFVRSAPSVPKVSVDLRGAVPRSNQDKEKLGEGEDEREADGLGDQIQQWKGGRPSTRPHARAELSDMVKEDPQTAAAILLDWIGEARRIDGK